MAETLHVVLAKVTVPEETFYTLFRKVALLVRAFYPLIRKVTISDILYKTFCNII